MNDSFLPSPGFVPAPIAVQASAEDFHRSEEEFSVLFELCPIATYVVDTAGVIVKFNDLASKLWGRAPAVGDTDEKFCGSHQLYLLDGTPLAHHECPMAQVVNGDVSLVIDAEVVIERPDGSRVAVIVNIRPLRDSQGEVSGAINCFYETAHPIAVPASAGPVDEQ